MASAEEYRRRAAEFKAKAGQAADASTAAEWQRLGRWYMRLADEADRNALMDVVYEPPSPKLSGKT
jgi:hypothetical protein